MLNLNTGSTFYDIFLTYIKKTGLEIYNFVEIMSKGREILPCQAVFIEIKAKFYQSTVVCYFRRQNANQKSDVGGIIHLRNYFIY